MSIILYDIPSKLPGNAWSPSTWKIRYYLNYRRIPYTTEWIEYPDIKPFSLKSSIPPTSISATGEPYFSLPTIQDTKKGVFVTDSQAIAEYLDEAYPESITGVPGVFPEGTLGLQTAFKGAFELLIKSHYRVLLPAVAPVLNPSSEVYFRKTRSALFKVDVLEDALPKGDEVKKQWAEVEGEWKKLASWYNPKVKGKYITGDRPTWADIVVGSELIFAKVVWGEKSEKWQDIERWDNGKWKQVVDSLEPFADTSA